MKSPFFSISPGEEFHSSLGGVEISMISRNFYVPPGAETKFFPWRSINKLDKNIFPCSVENTILIWKCHKVTCTHILNLSTFCCSKNFVKSFCLWSYEWLPKYLLDFTKYFSGVKYLSTKNISWNQLFSIVTTIVLTLHWRNFCQINSVSSLTDMW